MENDLGLMVRVIASLAIVLGLLFFCMFLVKRWQYRMSGQGKQNIQVLNTQMILPKRYVSLVRVCDKILILGVTDSSITLLGSIETNDFAEVLRQAHENGLDASSASPKTVH